jgi:hypothetical protein
MSRILAAATVALWVSVGWGKVHAQEPNTVWQCWYEGQGAIACVVEQVRNAPLQFAGATLSPDVPEILRVLRENPASIRGRMVAIPLHTVPYDMNNVARLAQLTVCGNRPDCQMTFSAQRPSAEVLDRFLNSVSER